MRPKVALAEPSVPASVAVAPSSFLRRQLRLVSQHSAIVVLSVLIVLVFVVVAVTSYVYTPHDPNALSFGQVYAGPSSRHLLGTDSLGRDIFSRWMVGIRYPLVGSALITVVSVAIGATLALVMAWKGRWVDATVGRALDVILAFPGLLLALLAEAIFGKGLLIAALALSVGHTPYVVRVLRSAALRERHLPYVTALQVQGFGAWAINARHIARNVGPYIAGQATLTFAGGFVALASLSFIGLGAQPPTADWGTMLFAGKADLLQGHYEQALSVALSIIVLTAAVNVLGERMLNREATS
jgi:peptide/nickel transport system permease protein